MSRNKIKPLLLSTLFLIGTIFVSSQLIAKPPEGHGAHGKMNMHGMHGMHGRYHHGHTWKRLMSKDQHSKYYKLKLDYKKKKLLLKADMKKSKLQLIILVTSASPDKSKINKNVDELLALKKKIILSKIDFKIAVRKILTSEQQVMFDMYLIKKAFKGKRRHFHH